MDTRVLATLVILTTIIYGIGIEYGQSLIPERYFSVNDAYANALGGILVIPWYVLRQYTEFVSLQEFSK